ncbi:inosine/xanthosine triphosphatase [Aestuariibacter salexigens]|uniref:inosine/xanthosine triphosphatase n=1 Tax=Aestuariibacter salexigens TaxID=226010 RepID=UPI0004791C66|nr:inosine/xanthosine triphosphatase [Aestuariibacter salexigens]
MDSMKIIVGSKNPVKVNATAHSFINAFPQHKIECLGVDAPSGVPDQPMNMTETRAGAINRLEFCRREYPQADSYVAIEGGVDRFEDGPCTFAVVAIDDGKQRSVGCSARLPLPEQIYQALLNGEELGDVMDRLFNQTNIKQKGGAIGLMTNGLASRQSAYEQALILALARFLHADLY